MTHPYLPCLVPCLVTVLFGGGGGIKIWLRLVVLLSGTGPLPYELSSKDFCRYLEEQCGDLEVKDRSQSESERVILRPRGHGVDVIDGLSCWDGL